MPTHFHYFIIISLKDQSYNKLQPLFPVLLCAKYGFNWSRGHTEKKENFRLTDRRTNGRMPDKK